MLLCSQMSINRRKFVFKKNAQNHSTSIKTSGVELETVALTIMEFQSAK